MDEPAKGNDAAEELETLSQNVLFLMMLIFCGGTFFMTNMSKIPLPYTVVLFLYGIFVGFFAHWITPDVATSLGNIPPELLFYIFLPVLIFEGSYAMNVHALRRVFPQVLILASVGVVVNTCLLALPVACFFPEWSWYSALLLGSLLSATDPVAVVSLLKGLGVDSRITAMVDGEAIMNDGTAIIAFKLLLPAARVGCLKDSTWNIILKGVQLAALPIIVGPVFGFIQSYWLRHATGGIVKTCITVSVTYVCYYVAGNIIGTSGVLTLFFSGTFLSFYCPSLFPGREGNLVYNIWEFLVHLGNTMLFSLVGLILVADVVPTLNILDLIIIICMYVAVIMARFLMLEILLPILNLFPYRMSQREVTLLAHAGLRGGVAVTLALAVLQTGIEAGVNILKVTCGVVLLSLFINATTAEKVVTFLGHKRKQEHRMIQMEYAMDHLEVVRQKALQKNKNNVSYRSANWAAAEAYVKEHLLNPYKGMSYLREDEDTVVNRLLMKAFKASLWRQRDENLISETVVLTISRAVARAIDSGELIEVRHLHRRKPSPHVEMTEELEARLIEENLKPLWVTVSEIFLGKGYLEWAHVRVQQNAFMTLLSFARCLDEVNPIKYQYAKNELHGRRIEAWMTSQREEVRRVIRLLYETYPAATMCIATSRAVLRAVNELRKGVEELHHYHGFGAKPTAALEEMVQHMYEHIPRSWEPPRLDNELVIAALAATPLGRGLDPEEINTLSAMGSTKNLYEGEEIKLEDKLFHVIVFGSLKPKLNRWTASSEGEYGFGCVIGLERFVVPPQLRDNQMNRWVVTSTECQVLCIAYRYIEPFLWEKSFASVRAFWRAVAVETLLPTLEHMITLPVNLTQSSRDHFTSIMMSGNPLIGPKECNAMDWSLQFQLCFYIRGSDTTGLFCNGHTAPCYVSAFFARRLKWEDPQVVLYAVPVNVSDSGYVPWSQSANKSPRGSFMPQRSSAAEADLSSAMMLDYIHHEPSSTYAEAADIFSSILRGIIPGENQPRSFKIDPPVADVGSFDGVDACILQNPENFVTNVPYLNQLFLRYATVLEGLCIAALRYVRVPTDPLNAKHAQYISEQALEFLMVFFNELTILSAALRRLSRRDTTTSSFAHGVKRQEKEEQLQDDELEDIRMIGKVIMWHRVAEMHGAFQLRTMVLQMKSLANRRFRYLSESLRALAEEQPSLKGADSVEELQRILLDLNP
ncbi:Na/H antiporter-like protein, putative [Trypanosoma cruzi]|uniref:Na/H antiporter-like protein, putative n=1 Tax=Trypanosoma cruzi (strain CL Brener) TaxID=353153 RepID=Q4D226_TRYCC|nr:Na/H antiporter-like protein, putative [Trypanosoma cruzi]EAN86578.1 Na/H antiporter-like protein, putative [Trypanosoma cruzi]|eukprot:XP_808429.1 Na/H antiporter-like protein [Trypanosoma cruzi strain CL Brener]